MAKRGLYSNINAKRKRIFSPEPAAMRLRLALMLL